MNENFTLDELALMRAFLLANQGKTLKKLLKEVEESMLDSITPQRSIIHQPTKEVVYATEESPSPTTHRDDCPEATGSVEEREEGGLTPIDLEHLARLKHLFRERKLPIHLKPGILQRKDEEPQLQMDGHTPEQILNYTLTGDHRFLHTALGT